MYHFSLFQPHFLGSLGDLSSTNTGIFSKGSLTPVACRNMVSRDPTPRVACDPASPDPDPQKPGKILTLLIKMLRFIFVSNK